MVPWKTAKESRGTVLMLPQKHEKQVKDWRSVLYQILVAAYTFANFCHLVKIPLSYRVWGQKSCPVAHSISPSLTERFLNNDWFDKSL